MAPRKRPVGPVLAFFSSFQLATLLFFFLLLLTLFGTLAQREMGIQDVIEKYFTSWLVLEEFPGRRAHAELATADVQVVLGLDPQRLLGLDLDDPRRLGGLGAPPRSPACMLSVNATFL